MKMLLYITLLLFPFIFFASKRFLTYLHFFQQEEYDNIRFLRWLIAKRIFDKKLSLILLGVMIFYDLFREHYVFSLLLLGIVYLIFAFKEKNPRHAAKKKLVFTYRAKRIYILSLSILVILSVLGILLLDVSIGIWVILIQIFPVIIILANILLFPFEQYNKIKYLKEAKAKLLTIKPFIIAITGSFGKTSVKHILGHILEMHAPTFITPGSVNTVMGITRLIREKLSSDCKYFIVEMGAYNKGSIDRICNLTPPNMGIITSVGKAHFERFRTLENISIAKFELACHVIAKQGLMVIDESVLVHSYAKNFVARHNENFILCNGDNSVVKVTEFLQKLDGIDFTIEYENNKYKIFTPLYGIKNAVNVSLAFATAIKLGISIETIITSLRTIPQIAHRLEVQKRDDGVIIIDDAFNSNPIGFQAALQLLEDLKKEGKYARNILATPGIVELGDRHDLEHAELGKAAAQTVDILLAVVPNRIQSFIDSFNKNKHNNSLVILCDTFKDAKTWLDMNMQKGDIILFENDLPDLYETKIKL